MPRESPWAHCLRCMKWKIMVISWLREVLGWIELFHRHGSMEFSLTVWKLRGMFDGSSLSREWSFYSCLALSRRKMCMKRKCAEYEMVLVDPINDRNCELSPRLPRSCAASLIVNAGFVPWSAVRNWSSRHDNRLFRVEEKKNQQKRRM